MAVERSKSDGCERLVALPHPRAIDERRLVAPAVAALAAECLTDGDLFALEGCYRDMIAAGDSPELFFEPDQATPPERRLSSCGGEAALALRRTARGG